MMDIYEELLKTGCHLSNYCSDLYVEINEQTKEIVNNYEYKRNVTIFRNEVTNQLNYEIPFAYDYRKLGGINS